MAGKLITAAHMQAQAQKIKSVLNSGGWKFEGTTAQIAYKYKNADSDKLKLQGVKSIDGLVDDGNSITLPSTAYDSDTQVTISGGQCSLTFDGNINTLIENTYASVASSGANALISIAGTGASISVTGSNTSIGGGASATSIFSGIDNASNVYVDTRASNNYVSIMSGAGTCTVKTNNHLYNYSRNQSGNVYILTADNIKTNIYGYKAEDTILIDGASYTYSVKSGVNYLYYEGDTSKYIRLKGALLEGKTALTSADSDYASLEGGTKLNISVKSGDKYVDRSTYSWFIGTANADTMNITVDNAVVSLSGGNDTVTVSGANASVTGAGNTSLLLTNTAANATVSLGSGADSVTVGAANVSLNAGRGANSILLEDTANYCTVISSDGADSVTVSAHSVSINGGAGIDRIVLLGGTNIDKDTLSANYGKPIAEKAVTICGGTYSDSIFAEDDYYVYTPTGGSETTVYASHVYQYANGDGSDSIYGWNSKDTLVITGATAISTMMSRIDEGRNKHFLLQIDSSTLTFVNIEPDTAVNLISKQNITTATADNYITVNANEVTPLIIPRIIIGTTGSDTLANDRDNYTISVGGGNDSVVNTGNNVYIDAGANADLISLGANADNITIEGGEGSDKIYLNEKAQIINYGNYANGNDSIFGIKSTDTIKLAEGIEVSMTADGRVATSINANGLNVYLKNTDTGDSAGQLVLKGAKKPNATGDAINDFEDIAHEVNFFNGDGSKISLRQKFIPVGDTPTISNSEPNYIITGTSSADTITNTANYVIIDAGDGNNTIYNSGSNVTINAGAGYDSVVNTGNNVYVGTGTYADTIISSGNYVTIDAGTSADLIVNNGGSKNIYKHLSGVDSIYGYNSDDTILIDNTGYIASVTANGFLILVNGSTSDAILLKGNLKTGATANSTNAEDYDSVAAGTKLNISVLSGDNYIDSSTTIPKLLVGTAAGDELNVVLADHTVDALGGNDIINVAANNVSINAGAGSDTIIISSGSGVTVKPGTDSDLIEVADTVGAGHLFEFALGDGVNTIKNFGENDTIHINSTNASIKTAAFEVLGDNEYYSLTLSDGKTKIALLERSGNNGKDCSTLRGKNFYIKYYDSETEIYRIPNEYILTPENPNLNATGSKFNNAVIVSTSVSSANSITVSSARNVSVDAKTGNDSIWIGSDASFVTINAGTGNDQITLNGSGHVIKYSYGDGYDSVWGWSENNTLEVSGSYAPAESINSSGYFIKVGSGHIYFADIAYDAKINVVYNGVNQTFTVPRVCIGTSNADTIENTIAGVSINANAGNDLITNTGNDVTIIGGAGLDSIYTSGNRVFVDGGTGVDNINVISGSNVTVNGGASNDVISVQAGVVNPVISGDTGNDVIYSNGQGAVIKYTSGGGNDSVFGYTSADTIQLAAGVNISLTDGKFATSLRPEGFTVYLSSGNYITFKGTKKPDATSNTINDFEDIAGGTVMIFYENGSNSPTRLIVPNEKLVSSVSHSLTNAEANYFINGTSSADTIKNTGANVTIQAGIKNDVITNTGNNVYIAGEIGADVIYLSDIATINGETVLSAATNNTIYGGSGNDTIYGNDNGHIYKFNAKTDGKDVVYNFTDKDIIYLGSYQDYWGTAGNFDGTEENLITATYSASENHYYADAVLKGLSSSSNCITLKNLKFNSKIRYQFEYSDSDSETKIASRELTVPRIFALSGGESPFNNTLSSSSIIGSSANDTVINNVADVSISAGSGDDSVYNGANGARLYLNGGAGNDIIENSGSNVTIIGGEGNDSIQSNGNSNVFQYAGNIAEGTDTIVAFASNDLIYINDSDCVVTDSIVDGDAQLQFTKGITNTYCVLIGKTTGDTVHIKLGEEGAVQTYTVGTGF